MTALDKEIHSVVLVGETGTLPTMQCSQRHEITRINRDSELLTTLTNSSIEDRLTPLDVTRSSVRPMPVQVAGPLAQLEQDLLTTAILTTKHHIDSRYQLEAIIHPHTVTGTGDTQRRTEHLLRSSATR